MTDAWCALRFTTFLLACSWTTPICAESPSLALDKTTNAQDPHRVLIIGDSISIQGYTKHVAATLQGQMVLHHHADNAETTRNGLAKLDAWLAEAGGNWDIIHFNWGLWDLRHRATHVPLAEYTSNMQKLVDRLKRTKATLIFATTTPVPPINGMKRRDSDVQAYNAAAVAIMKREGIAIDDLYGFIEPTLAEHQRKNDVHFNQAGYKRLSESVAIALRNAAQKTSTPQVPKDATEKPNLLVIVADDMGWADVGYHGSSIETPVIDRLCREGVELDRHYVAPMCTPTRAALLTGRYWSRFGNTTPSNTRVLPWNTVTLAGALRAGGYKTFITGKWHLGSQPEWGPLKFGFDYSHGSLAGGVNPLNHLYKHGPYSNTWHRNDVLIEQIGHVTDLIADEAVRYIKTQNEQPFFLYVPFTAVHTPFDEPQEWLDRAAHLPEGRRQYAACAQHMDYAIGQIVQALRDRKQLANTLIVFFSDNGGTNGDDSSLYPDTKVQGTIRGLNTPLRGWKKEVYEGGIRVPAVAYWPKRLKPRVLTMPLHVVDWMPTLCAVAGCETKTDLQWDGRNIWPLLTGEMRQPEPRVLYCQGVNSRSAALHRGDWKLVVHGRGKQSTRELFKLSTDPEEQFDLASKHPLRVQELTQLLVSEETKDNDALPIDN